ncbi:PLP-dependent aminotransferase family protein [Compostimonas suwonensis]|uniref:DNA-binding transcriptional MocR family regulator n=1 Tax=Compostimonas suwonensis TaxID=1048394 RepID=A0A2M9BZY3_9MICO|nr:aminotransferase class I/II-fold pyridoxal phosphate-dependent enzyme [Compostimonas suwonensis]PJJ63649.1 DNA-binding transcriptional MocR family regulator [Compostimonas suwonensis]
MHGFAATISDRSPQGIAAVIARGISSGELAPGDRLPTVRDLAAGLGVSPATVSHAWQLLSGAGLIVSRGRSGTFVRQRSTAWLPPRMIGLAGHLDGSRVDLSRGTPDPELLPALAPALSRISRGAETDSYQEAPVIPELRALLADSWPYSVDTVTIVDGALDGISRTLGQLVRYGDRVAVENPGFPPFFDLLDELGAEKLAVDVDEHGMTPESLSAALAQAPVAVILQPRAHNPTGASMTPGRAEELARVVRTSRHGREAVIVEDDHSGEISIVPDVSLGRWLPGQTVHVRSFSKSHGPDLRIAALGGPAALVDRIVARRILGPGWTSRILQEVLHDLLTAGRSIDEVGEARRVYYARQRSLVLAAAAHGLTIAPADGINAWVRVDDERRTLVQLAAAGIRVAAGSPFLMTESPRAQYVRVTAGMIREDAATIGHALASAAALPHPVAAGGHVSR